MKSIWFFLFILISGAGGLILSCAKNPVAPPQGLPPTSTPTPLPTVTPIPTPVPAAAGVFQDFETGNGTFGDYFWDQYKSRPSFETIVTHNGGGRSVQAQMHWQADDPANHGGTLGVNAATYRSMNLSRATVFYIWVKDTQGNNSIQLKIRDQSGLVSEPLWSTSSSQLNVWTKISWPLSDPAFSAIKKNRILNFEIYEYNDGVYYFDDAGWE